MKQLKISLKLLALFMATVFMAVGCQKDDNVTDNTEPQNQYKKPPSFSADIFHGDSIINANAGLKNRLNQFNKTKAALRTMQSSEYNFSIDTTRVQKIQTSSYTSYTFTVVRPYPVEDVLENYVITHYSNDTYRQYFISYPHIDSNGEIAYDIDNAQISVLNDDSLVYYRDSPNCVSVIAYVDPVCVDIRCLSGEHTVDQGSLCRYWGTSNMATRECTEGGWVDQGCSGGDGGTSGGDTGGNNNGGNGPGDIEDTSDDEPEDEIFVPLSPTVAQEIENCINRPTLIGETDTTTIAPGLIASLNLGKSQLMDINNYLDQNQCSEQAQAFANEIINLAILEPNQSDVSNLVNLSLLIENSGNELFTDQFASSLFNYIDIDLVSLPPDYPPNLLTLKVFLNYVKLRQLNPEWSRGKCIWYAAREIIHISLDVFGLIPVVGEAADLVNGALYTIEGDNLNATLSVASAIPFVGYGSVATKYGLKVVNVASTVTTKVKLVWKVTANGIDFGSSSTLRKVLGLTDNALQAHHIMPWAWRNHDVIQKAAKSGNAFHMNEALNGIAVASWRNQPNHTAYSNLVKSKLDLFLLQNPNATPQECYNFLSNLIQNIRNWVINNPNSHLNNLVLP